MISQKKYLMESFVLEETVKIDDFTHEVYDGEELIRRYRWTKDQAKWYSEQHPHLKIVKLKVERTSDYESALKLVGECLV